MLTPLFVFIDLAAKELAAFRAVYKEQSDELLPPDLRGPKQ